jgi:FixJ family two-component response regulator
MSVDGTVFLVEDDEPLRRATERLLASHGFTVASSASAEEFLAGFDPARAGCLLLDLRLPGESGIALQQRLSSQGSHLPIVFLTGHADVPTSVFAMKHGAVDLLEKPVDEAVLVAALGRALEKDRLRRGERAELSELEGRLATLTAREREVLVEIVAGRLNKQTARVLGIAERTVKLHRARVLQKMGVASLAELARIAERLGIGSKR